ncbi:MAG: DUF6057 family protein [Phycisphaerae bacterium]|nr:DUF6057 family protein [Phycisphaerae bacterium]
MQSHIKRWPHHGVFLVVCLVYLALVTEPYLLYSCFGSLLPEVPAFSASTAFLINAVSRPGGCISALTGLLSQCFYGSWPGALAIMATALGLSELTRRHFKAAGFGLLTGLTCVPVIMIILIYNRYQHPLLGVLVVSLGLLGAYLAQWPCRHATWGALLLCVTTVVTFWFGGTGALAVCLAMTLIHALRDRKQGLALVLGMPMALAVIGLLLYYVARIGVAQAWPLTLPHSKLVTGGMKTYSKALMLALYGYAPVCLAVLWLGRLAWQRLHRDLEKKARKNKKAHAMDRTERRPGWFRTVCVSVFPFVLLGLSLYFSHDPLSKPYVQIHHYSHLGQWDQVLEAGASLPKGQTSVYVNHAIIRALFHTHRLAFDLLKYPQTQLGLFLTHEKKVSALTQLKLHDLYLDLGQVNMAEKQISEMLAADIDFGCIYERLIWIHIIKEQYETARIFVNALHKDPLYRRTASTLAHILDHGLPEDQAKRVERIRALMPRHTEPVCESVDQMLLQLLNHNPDNQMAFEYLMTLYCLTGQVNKVAEWLPYTARFPYPATPALYQEAAVIYFVARKEVVDTQRMPIAPETLKRCNRFMQLKTAFQKTKKKALLGQLIEEFGSSYFFYFAFGQVGIK